jgi:hypothetical protein
MVRSRRQPKSRKDLKRRAAFRQERDRVLIVTEGSKTEPDYFRRLIEELGLTTAKVVIVGDGGSAPISVVEDAIKRLSQDDDFEQVYCVFDRDRHASYDQALQALNELAGSTGFKSKVVLAIPSVPCFELWYLLHVSDSRKPYEAAATGGSPGQALLADLCKKNEFSNYEKSGCQAFFETIRPYREIAVQRAESFLRAASAEGAQEYHENPSTRVYLIVEGLRKIARQQDDEKS